MKVKFSSFIVTLFCFLAICNSYSQIKRSASDVDREINIDNHALNFSSPKSELETNQYRVQGIFPRITLDKPVDPDQYIVGVGDQLILLTFGKLESENLITVGPEGKVVLPEVGELDVVRQTLSDVRKNIISKMEQRYPRLKFQLLLAQPRAFKIYVLGEIRRPGVYVSSALDRTSDIVAQAGGISSSGTKRKIEIRRGDKIIYADLYLFENKGDLSANPYLLENDIIFVPFSLSKVTLGGGVKNPGIYELDDGEDLYSLIKRTGGITNQADISEDIKIVRFIKGSKKQTIKVELKDTMSGSKGKLILKDGDTIFVPSGVDMPYNESNIYLSGQVRKPGAYPYQPGYTAKTYVGLAGGLTERARYSQAEIIKADGTKVSLKEDTVLELGDTINVPEKFIKVWQDCLVITTSISSLTLAVIAALK